MDDDKIVRQNERNYEELVTKPASTFYNQKYLGLQSKYLITIKNAFDMTRHIAWAQTAGLQPRGLTPIWKHLIKR